MSRRSTDTAAERTALMVDLVRQSYPTGEGQASLPAVVIQEVAPGVGWSAAAEYWLDHFRGPSGTYTGKMRTEEFIKAAGLLARELFVGAPSAPTADKEQSK